MTGLKELQDSFQDALLQGNLAVLDHICDSKKEKRETLFGIYSNAYVSRLVEFIMNDYERLHEYLGDDQFYQAARAYVAAHPSRNPNARWFGSALPEFLSANEPFSGYPQIAEIAVLERALNDTFDAPDAETLKLEDLSTIDPSDWPELRFIPHPATRRMNLNTNAADIWSAMIGEASVPESCRLEEPVRIIVYREGTMSRFRTMEYAEAMMWDEAAKGIPFGGLCEMMATYAEPEEAPLLAAGYLQVWIAAGMLSGIELS